MQRDRNDRSHSAWAWLEEDPTPHQKVHQLNQLSSRQFSAVLRSRSKSLSWIFFPQAPPWFRWRPRTPTTPRTGTAPRWCTASWRASRTSPWTPRPVSDALHASLPRKYSSHRQCPAGLCVPASLLAFFISSVDEKAVVLSVIIKKQHGENISTCFLKSAGLKKTAALFKSHSMTLCSWKLGLWGFSQRSTLQETRSQS